MDRIFIASETNTASTQFSKSQLRGTIIKSSSEAFNLANYSQWKYSPCSR